MRKSNEKNRFDFLIFYSMLYVEEHATMSADLDSLRPHYRIEPHGSVYHIYCKVCGQGWSLPAGSVKVGAILKLLDHAHSHIEEEEQP